MDLKSTDNKINKLMIAINYINLTFAFSLKLKLNTFGLAIYHYRGKPCIHRYWF